jgi:hypothetical protein
LQRETTAGRDAGEDGKLPINGLENFPGCAKRRLKAYHGGCKHSF